jgi:hypothetical protein
MKYLGALIALLSTGVSSHAASSVAITDDNSRYGFAKNYATLAKAKEEALRQCLGGKMYRFSELKGWWSIDTCTTLTSTDPLFVACYGYKTKEEAGAG